MRRAVVVLVAVILTLLTLMLLAGHGPFAGRPIYAVAPSHGLNTGDVPVLGGWLVGMVCCAWLWRDAGRR